METIALYTLIGTAAGVLGTAGGGLSAYLFRTENRGVLGIALDFAAGMMLAVVCFELLPQAFALGVFVNALATSGLERIWYPV